MNANDMIKYLEGIDERAIFAIVFALLILISLTFELSLILPWGMLITFVGIKIIRRILSTASTRKEE